MMTLDQGGDEGAMLYAQVGQHHLARATETSPERSSGHLSCLSARPHDLADAAITRPRVVAGGRVIEHCPVCILQARGGNAIPRLALWAIERFVAVTSTPAVEPPAGV